MTGFFRLAELRCRGARRSRRTCAAHRGKPYRSPTSRRSETGTQRGLRCAERREPRRPQLPRASRHARDATTMDAAFRKLQAEKAAERGRNGAQGGAARAQKAPEPRTDKPLMRKGRSQGWVVAPQIGDDHQAEIPDAPTRRARGPRRGRDAKASNVSDGNWRGKPATGNLIRMGTRAGPVAISFWPRGTPWMKVIRKAGRRDGRDRRPRGH